ncbi:hypothetical protein FVE85_8713 [Porphyridium purpureum]|uniref:Uncharacterized protein n=1 Tax=Porphyridium purpureum TaxID=35688 RepID=A0A5J4YPN4_PORPP|nr:hypothetical protein FVE85_8713 [Porphyridium purpureum]|eukprot:POR0658..scf296_7
MSGVGKFWGMDRAEMIKSLERKRMAEAKLKQQQQEQQEQEQQRQAQQEQGGSEGCSRSGAAAGAQEAPILNTKDDHLLDAMHTQGEADPLDILERRAKGSADDEMKRYNAVQKALGHESGEQSAQRRHAGAEPEAGVD